MLQRPNPSDDRGVSPVIGVILMVAITVILAAVIATFVLGLGEQISTTGPTAEFDFESDGEDLTIAFNNGNTIDAENLAITGVGDDDRDKWDASHTTVGAGDRVTVTPNDGETVSVVWESEGQSRTLSTWNR